MPSFQLGFDKYALALFYQTNKLQNAHRKPVLTVHLYYNGHINLVVHKPPRRADMSKIQLFCDL